jgi:hypothetical protein
MSTRGVSIQPVKPGLAELLCQRHGADVLAFETFLAVRGERSGKRLGDKNMAGLDNGFQARGLCLVSRLLRVLISLAHYGIVILVIL